MARGTGPAAAAVALGRLAEQVRPVVLSREQRLPVLPALAPLLPGGELRRGNAISVGAAPGASGATSLALALVAEACASGSWVAVVGVRSLGLGAAAELGVALERLVVVAAPGRAKWATVAATLVDGFDLVIVRPESGLPAGGARRLAARARERASVLVQLGAGWESGAAGWESGAAGWPGHATADVRLRVLSATWEGLDEGHGHLRARRVVVEANGRGEAARPRRAELWLPSPTGAAAAALGPQGACGAARTQDGDGGPARRWRPA